MTPFSLAVQEGILYISTAPMYIFLNINLGLWARRVPLLQAKERSPLVSSNPIVDELVVLANLIV